MLGYRHAFHAGNHADILKHIALHGCLRYLTQKEKPLLFADTHAGAGAYRLEAGYAAINREWESGLGRLRAFSRMSPPPSPAREYLSFLSDYESAHHGEYPGSPVLASRCLRLQDRLFLCELHPTDFGELSQLFKGDARAQVRKEDGFSALKSILPPPSRRGLIFMDPSYEVPSDYDRAVQTVDDALRRFATGTYVIWYPLLERPEAQAFPDRIQDLSDRPGLRFSLRVRRQNPGERGMAGSGMVIVNPPWRLESELKNLLPYLVRALGQDADAKWSLTSSPPFSRRFYR